MTSSGDSAAISAWDSGEPPARLALPREGIGPSHGLVGQIIDGREPTGRARQSGLLQRVIDRREHGVEVRAQSVHRDDDGDRDACRDQSIFDGGCARGVREEFHNHALQFRLLEINCREFGRPHTDTGDDLRPAEGGRRDFC